MSKQPNIEVAVSAYMSRIGSKGGKAGRGKPKNLLPGQARARALRGHATRRAKAKKSS